MKYPILTLCLIGVIQAFSFESAAQEVPQTREAVVNQNGIPVYKSATDTLKPAAFLSKSNPVTVLQVNGRWATVRRGKTEYAVATRYLTMEAPAEEQATGATVKLTGPPLYAVARTTSMMLKRTARFMTLDAGVKPPYSQPYYIGADGQPLAFETEAVVLNFLDGLGWTIIDSRQELTTEAAQKIGVRDYSYDVVYILKRK